MILIEKPEEYKGTQRTSVTLGKFDGIHRGHRSLIKKTVESAGKSLCPVVFAFDISPETLLTKTERRAVLEKMGVGCLIECPFTASVIRMSPEEFVREVLVAQLHISCAAVGPNFRFGYERAGDTEMLRELGFRLGFSVDIVPVVTDDQGEISSSRIRSLLAGGKMEEVNELLGYPFFVTGEIVHGRHVGRTLGVPTTNIIPEKSKLLPPMGVYASETRIGEKIYRGVTDIGTKPTVEGQFVGIETFLFDCDEDLYGEEEEVRILSFLRPEVKFPSIEALKAQLMKDEKSGREYFRNHPFSLT